MRVHTDLDESGFARGATAQHVLGIIDLGLCEPRRIGGWRERSVDDVAALVTADIRLVPDFTPEIVDAVGRPLVQIKVRREPPGVFGTDLLQEPDCPRSFGGRGIVESSRIRVPTGDLRWSGLGRSLVGSGGVQHRSRKSGRSGRRIRSNQRRCSIERGPRRTYGRCLIERRGAAQVASTMALRGCKKHREAFHYIARARSRRSDDTCRVVSANHGNHWTES